jgi:MFS family permease
VTPALPKSLSGLPRSYWWLWSGTLVSSAGGFVVPFLTLYLTSARGYPIAFAGLTLTVFGTGSGIASYAGGVLTDRLGRRPVLLGAEVFSVVGLLGLGLARNQALIILFAFSVGVGMSANRPARAAAIHDLVPEADRSRAFSLNYWAINLGFSVAAVTAGLAVGSGYLLLFLVNAAANLATGVLLYLKLPETRSAAVRRQEAQQARQSGQGSLAVVLRDRPFLLLLGTFLLLGVVLQEPIVTLPLAMTRSGLSAADYGAAMTMNGLTIALLQIPVTRLVSRLPPRAALVLASLLVGVGMGATAEARGVLGYGATVVLWTLGEIIVWPTYMERVAALAPVGMQGRYQGCFTMMYSIAVAVAPVLSSQAIQRYGIPVVWAGCLVLGLVCAAVHLLTGPAQGGGGGSVLEQEQVDVPTAS